MIKDNIWSLNNPLPYKRLHAWITIVMVIILCFWINSFTKNWGICLKTSTWYLIDNLKVGFLKHFWLPSGAYDKTFNYTTPSNTLDPCTTRGAPLGLVYNTQGGYKSFSLKTGNISLIPNWMISHYQKKLSNMWRCLYWTRYNPLI